jgi:hypothetical protein
LARGSADDHRRRSPDIGGIGIDAIGIGGIGIGGIGIGAAEKPLKIAENKGYGGLYNDKKAAAANQTPAAGP